MEKLAAPVGSDEPAGDDTKKARAEHFQAIRNKIDELDDACAQTEQIVRDLRRMFRR
jgi:hypothetical protein